MIRRLPTLYLKRQLLLKATALKHFGLESLPTLETFMLPGAQLQEIYECSGIITNIVSEQGSFVDQSRVNMHHLKSVSHFIKSVLILPIKIVIWG